MFNYYKRIAALANEMEADGRKDKAYKMRLILEVEKRCLICGGELQYGESMDCKSTLKCCECSKEYFID